MLFEGKNWQVDRPFDINLDGLFFIKTKRHVEELENLTSGETSEIGSLIKKFSKESRKKSNAQRVLAMSLGLSDPHVHFWIIPVTKKTEKDLVKIKKIMREFVDKYR